MECIRIKHIYCYCYFSIFSAYRYGFDSDGVWKPVGINDVFKLSRYGTNGHFMPHLDGCFVINNSLRSAFTLLVWLNDEYPLLFTSLLLGLPQVRFARCYYCQKPGVPKKNQKHWRTIFKIC